MDRDSEVKIEKRDNNGRQRENCQMERQRERDTAVKITPSRIKQAIKKADQRH